MSETSCMSCDIHSSEDQSSWSGRRNFVADSSRLAALELQGCVTFNRK